jgi:hypothetical protein
MSYASQFNHNQYTIPAFFLKPLNGWADMSYHNDTCPRWINTQLKLNVWVDCDSHEDREFDGEGNWKRLNVVPLIDQEGFLGLGDDLLFSTEDEQLLEAWIGTYEIKLGFESTFQKINQLKEPIPELADNVASLIATADEMLERMKKW